jgi:hypothetical protein
MSELSAYEGKLYWDTGAGAVLIGQVRDIEGPGMTQDMVDVASRDSGKLTAYLGGLRSSGDVTFEIIYDPDLATQNTLTASLLAGTQGRLFLVLRELTENGWHSGAQVSSFKPKAPLRDGLSADVTFEMLDTISELRYLEDGAGNYMVDGGNSYWVA